MKLPFKDKTDFVLAIAWIIILTITLTLVISSCSNEAMYQKDESDVYEEAKSEVTITLPAYIFGGDEEFDPQVLKDEYGYTAVVVHEDGSVSLTMTKAKHEELMKSLKENFLKEFAAMVNAEDTQFIKNITANDDFTEIVVDIEKEAHGSAFFDIIPEVLAHAAAIYQQYNGQEPHYTIIFRNAADSEEILSSVIFPEPEEIIAPADEEADAEDTSDEAATEEAAE